MAIDPHAPPAVEKAEESSPIENEIPTYRAISPLAIASLVFGLIAGLSFADPSFLVAAALAISFGIMAELRIRKLPDVLTGRGLAQIGIALGLIFGLSSMTYGYVQQLLVRQRAEAFAKTELVELLNSRDLNGALWYRMQPEARRGMTPEQARKTFEEPGTSNQAFFEMQAGPIIQVLKTLDSDEKAKVEYVGIEQSAFDGLNPVAFVVLRIHPSTQPADSHDDHEKLIGVMIKGTMEGRETSWWVSEYVFPYKRNTYVEKIEPVDDGHGHGPNH